MFCSGRRVSVLQPPYVLLLSPRRSAGPAGGSSALSRSVAQHLLFLRLAALLPPIWCFAPLALPLGWSGCGVVCIELLSRSAPVILLREDGLLKPLGVCSSPLTPAPYVMLLSPRLLAGPVAGSSALSHSVARHLLFVPRRAYVAHMAMMVCWSRGRLH